MRLDFTTHTTLHPSNCALKLVLIYRPHPVYYQEIFSDFQKMNKVSNDNVKHIRTQSLWYNDNIKIRNQPVFFKNMYDLGIKVLDDLVGINGRIMNVNQIQQKFPTLGIDFLRLNGLISAIPMDWRQLLRQYPNLKGLTQL